MALLTHPAQLSEALGIPFSAQQLAAITAPLEPSVIIAGAGSGKTTVMAARVVWLVGTGQVRPEQVLGLTFTRKAAAELSGRVRAALAGARVVDATGDDDAGEQVIMTYDAFASRLVADHGLRIGVEGDARMLTGASRFRMASKVVSRAPGPWAELARLRPDSVTDKVLTLDAELSSHLVAPERLLDHAFTVIGGVESSPRSRTKDLYASMKRAAAIAAERAELSGLVEDYQRLKREMGAVEFADQMGVAADLARRVPDVSRALRSQFRVVLLDEYQDTSSAQAALLSALFSGERPDDGRGFPVTAVGDPCQAIYGWRGAAAANIITFATHFPRSDGSPATGYALTVNRRSGQRILDAANVLSAPLRLDKELQWDGIDSDLVAPPGTPPGDIAVASFATWPGEMSWIADDIAAAHDSGRAVRWSDIAVLARRNQHIRPLYGELLARGIPVEIVGLDGLLAVPEVADVVAMLRVLGDATANPDLVRILTGPRWSIGPADLAVLGRRARELAGGESPTEERDPREEIAAIIDQTEAAQSPSLAEALIDLGEGPYSAAGRVRLTQCGRELSGLRGHVGAPVTDLVRRIITLLGLEVELALRGPHGTRQLDAFVSQVAGYADLDGDGSLTGLLAWLAAEEEHGVGLEQAVPTASDSVKLLTIHRAKGLEWEVVYLPALADKVFPSDRVQGNWLGRSDVLPADLRGDADNVAQLADYSDADAKAYAEALKAEARRADDRLAYVAVTRARQHLVATTHAWSDLIKPRAVSPYLTVLEGFAEEPLHEPIPPSNPLLSEGGGFPWPAPRDEAQWLVRTEAVEAVRAAQADPTGVDEPVVFLDEAAEVARWDQAADQLLAEARLRRGQDVSAVAPPYWSPTSLIAARTSPEEFRADLVRPMPSPPRRAARVGEEFHAWLERRGRDNPALLQAPDAVPRDPALRRLIAAFEAGPYADRRPVATEVAFSLFLGGDVVRGRIDAIFATPDGDQVVDWKTGRSQVPDALQLALYRLAWSELSGRTPEQVDAVFYDVLDATIIRPSPLPGRPELERLIGEARGRG